MIPRDIAGFYHRVLKRLEDEAIPFMVGGAFALRSYTGLRRDTKDLDVFLLEKDLERALRAASAAGLSTRVKAPHWLAKIERGDAFVDLIYNSGNGACPVDQDWFRHAPRDRLFGVDAPLTPPEEMIWSKSFIMERGRYDGADIAHLLRARGRSMDWARLIGRFGSDWPVLLSHLILFRFIYPGERDAIPESIYHELLERLPGRSRDGKLCRGTLLSFAEYLPDLRWGYRDARLRSMTQREIDHWTREPKD